MDSFLKELYHQIPLNDFAVEMKKFWKEYSKRREKNFAQQGYEDKGYGHCERIIVNVGELLEKYCEILYKLNKKNFRNGTGLSEKEFKKQFKNHLEPNLILFILSAFLHDIGMCFPGIFKALSDVLKGSGDSAAHISKIIHDYHNYATFIVLLEMNSLNGKVPYLDVIPNIFKENDKKKIENLKKRLTGIYQYYSTKYNSGLKKNILISQEDFFIILGIICLHHQKVESHYVQSILRKFIPDRKETVDLFNKWDAFFDRSREWTDLAPDWFPKELKLETEKKPNSKTNNDSKKNNEFIGPELISAKEDTKIKLDLLLVEALLQYGDKTEITIARLMKPTEGNKPMTGLKKFWQDTRWDNEKGYICTNMAQEVISSYARFRACRFIPLFLVKVIKNERTHPVSLDVMMHYFRFPKDKDVFSFIRYHNEKDFQDLKFLDIIKFHLPVLLRYFNHQEIEQEKWIIQRLEINLKRKEFLFPAIDNELKRLLPPILKKNGTTFFKEIISSQNMSPDEKTQITSFLNKIEVRENGQVKHIDFSNLGKYEVRKRLADFLRCLEVKEILQKIFDKLASLEKTDYIVKGQKIKNSLGSLSQNNKCPYHKLKKLNDILNHEYNRDNMIYALYEELNFIFYCFPIININSNKQDIMKKMQDGIVFLQEKLDEAGNKRPEERFPYTPQNREAIIEFSRSIKKKRDNKELFFKSSGLTIPPSFDLMAILNLFQQEE